MMIPEKTNVFIIDYNTQIFSSLIKSPEINIVGVCVNYESEKKAIISQYSHILVYLREEIVNWDGSFVTLEDIRLHSKSQIKVEHFFERYLECSFSERLSYYYSSLAFWTYIFNNYNIDCVLIGEIEHGNPADTLAMDFAVERGIPTYIFEIMLFNYNDRNRYFAIKSCNTNTYINLNTVFPAYMPISNLETYINSFICTPKKIKCSEKTKITPDDLCVYSLNISIKKIIASIINGLLFIPQNILYLTNTPFDTKQEGVKIFWKMARTYLYTYYLLSWILRRDIKQEVQGHTTYSPAKKYLKGWQRVMRLKHYYQKISVKTIPQGQKYVLYALHLEPEASIMARTIYNSQIYNISMLAKSLPSGWKLYVKEHPQQFDTVKGSIYLKKSYAYRDNGYYKKILSLPNTYLLDYQLSSQSLLKANTSHINPRPKAVATINGSITLEAIVNNIPTLLFDKKTVSYDSPIIFEVTKQEDIINCLHAIETQSVQCNDLNDTIDSLKKTLFICTPSINFVLPDDLIKNLVMQSYDFKCRSPDSSPSNIINHHIT